MSIPTNLPIKAVAYNGTNIPLANTPTGTINITPSTSSQSIDVTSYATAAVAAMPSGTLGTVSASKTISGNTATVTPSISAGTAGYNAMAAKSGSAVTVTASEVTSGNKSCASGTSAQTNIDVTNYKTVSISAIASGTMGTVSASKSINNHTATITPSISAGTAGYNAMTAKTGTAVTVSANELVSGTLAISSDGTYDVTNYASVAVSGGGSGGTIYKFYTQGGTEITDITVSGLANAYYYTKNNGSQQRVGGRIYYIDDTVKEGAADKFYVYDTVKGLVDRKIWDSAPEFPHFGCHYDYLSGGKLNTSIMIEQRGDEEDTIWEFVKYTMNQGAVGGCNDWYVPNHLEMKKLKSTSLVDYWENDIWTSLDSFTSSDTAVYWQYGDGDWYTDDKTRYIAVFFIRSF